MGLQLYIDVLLLVEEVPAPGFNTLDLLLFPKFVFAAGSVQDSPSPAAGAGGRGSGRSQLSHILRATFGCSRAKFGDTSGPFTDPSLVKCEFSALKSLPPAGGLRPGEGREGRRIPSAKQGAGGTLRAGRKGDVASLNIPPENQERH